MNRADDFGNEALDPRVAKDKPGFPCRACLRDAEVGERLLLCSFTPFVKPGPYRAIGPVFLHERSCDPFIDRGEVPEILRTRLVSLRAYDDREELRSAEVVDGGLALIEQATAMFSDPRIHHIDVHLARPGCFACRLERS
ncbi:MAG: DUF1203 domain-containing protein [Myxococcaceae bacterium]